MNKQTSISTITALLCLLFLFVSCKKQEDEIPLSKDPVNNELPYKQYGTPFTDVPATADIVMYEVNLRAFSTAGNIAGVTAKLDHIKSLGVNVIWLMPIHPMGVEKSVGSPYAIKDFKAVGEEYGTLQDIRNFTDEAHKRGMSVILDWVANHTSWDNAWIQNKDWYTQDANGNIIHPAGTNWQDVADLNYSNAQMREAMIDAMLFWVLEANVDGYRCDHADGVPTDFWQTAIKRIKEMPNRKFVFFAEGVRKANFEAGFDLNFGWSFYTATKDVFKGESINRIFTNHSTEYSNTPEGKHWLRFTTNHDDSAWDATPITLFNGVNGALAASVITVFTGGVPLIYGSQEVGRSNTLPFFTRSPINWNANAQMLSAYQRIFAFYNKHQAARIGANIRFSHNDIFSITKKHGDNEICILVNVKNENITYAIPAELKSKTWRNGENDTDFPLGTALNFAPYQYYLLELKK